MNGHGTRPRMAGLDLLVVDDETLFSMDLEIMLEDLGHRVAAVTSHVDGALEFIALHGASIDAALVNPVLALRSARPVTEALERLQIPVIGIAPDAQSRVLLTDNCPVLSKPCTPAMLRTALRQAMPPVAA